MTTGAPPLEVGLAVGPVSVEHGGLGADFTVSVRNAGDQTVDPNVRASELLVDDEPYDSWTLAIGNGAGTSDERELAPGRSLRLTRRVGLDPFDPGEHTFRIELAGRASEPVTVVVPGPADPSDGPG